MVVVGGGKLELRPKEDWSVMIKVISVFGERGV